MFSLDILHKAVTVKCKPIDVVIINLDPLKGEQRKFLSLSEPTTSTHQHIKTIHSWKGEMKPRSVQNNEQEKLLSTNGSECKYDAKLKTGLILTNKVANLKEKLKSTKNDEIALINISAKEEEQIYSSSRSTFAEDHALLQCNILSTANNVADGSSCTTQSNTLQNTSCVKKNNELPFESNVEDRIYNSKMIGSCDKMETIDNTAKASFDFNECADESSCFNTGETTTLLRTTNLEDVIFGKNCFASHNAQNPLFKGDPKYLTSAHTPV